MAMTKHHFELIARTIAGLKPEINGTPDQIGERELEIFYETCHAFGDALKSENPGFKPERFYRACGLES